jgi:hypothetical protein
MLRRLLPRPPARYGSFEALPPEALEMVIDFMSSEDTGALALASKGTRRAVWRALDVFEPVAALLPPPPPRDGYVFSNATCVVLMHTWKPFFGAQPSGSLLPVVAQYMPLLRSCTLELGGDALPTAWPPGLKRLGMFNVSREAAAALNSAPDLRQSLSSLCLCGPLTYWGRQPPLDPPALVGFTALRKLSLAAFHAVCWRVCPDTTTQLTSIRLQGIVNLWASPRSFADVETDGAVAVPLVLRAPAACLLRLRRAWPNLCHLEVPDDGFCPSRDGGPRPFLFSEAFPNLEALSVATTPARAPALAASLYALKTLRRLVIRRPSNRGLVRSWDEAQATMAKAALAMAQAVYSSNNSIGTGSSPRARALALGGLAPLARSHPAGAGLELIVGVGRESFACSGGSPVSEDVAKSRWSFNRMADRAVFGSEDGRARAGTEDACVREFVGAVRAAQWRMADRSFNPPLVEAGPPRTEAGEASGASGSTAGPLAVLTPADGSNEGFVIASLQPGVTIGAAGSEERLRAAERALFSLCAWPPESPLYGEASGAGWCAAAQPPPPADPALFAPDRVHLLPETLRARLSRLELDASQLLAASTLPGAAPSASTPPPSPLLGALPRLCKLHLRAGETTPECARLVWEVLAGGVVYAGRDVGDGGGGGSSGVGGGSVDGGSPTRARSSFGAAIAEAAELAAATTNPRSSASSPAPSAAPPLEWLRLEGFADAGSSPASLRAIGRYGPTLLALEIVGAERAPPAAPLIELLSRRFSPSFRYLCIQSTVLPAGWLGQVAALLAQPSAHVSSSAWVAHVLAALPGLPAAMALVAALAAAAVRQAPRLPEMALTAHLAAALAVGVGSAAALRVWAVAAAEALSNRWLDPPGAALAGRLRLLSLRGCTAEDGPRDDAGAGRTAGAGTKATAATSALVALTRACPRLRYLDLWYYNCSLAELELICGAHAAPASRAHDEDGGDAAPGPALGSARPPLSSSLTYVNTHHSISVAPQAAKMVPLLVSDERFENEVIERY